MNLFTSATINGCHLLRDLGLALSRTDCVQPPEPKSVTQDLPGTDGLMDLSDSLTGRIMYANREIIMEVGRGLERSRWPDMYSRILSLFHGKIVKVIFDDDPEYFYTGRATVSDYARTQTLGTLTITVDAKPYKYDVAPKYQDLAVDGRLAVTVRGRDKEAVPVITSDAAMALWWQGSQYGLAPGDNKLYDLTIKKGDNVLTFIGRGVITIDYRGGTL